MVLLGQQEGRWPLKRRLTIEKLSVNGKQKAKAIVDVIMVLLYM